MNPFQRLISSRTVSPANGAVGGAGAASLANWLLRLAKGTIFAALFLVPLFSLPFTPDWLLAKVVLIEVAAAVATSAWLFAVLKTRRISYVRWPLNVAFLALALVLIAAAIFGEAPWTSLWGSDLTGEKTVTLLASLALAFVAAAIFNTRDAVRGAAMLVASFLLLGLWVLAAVFFDRAGVALPAWLASNPSGTLNSLAMTLAAGFLLSAGLTLAGVTSAGQRVLSRKLFGFGLAAAVILFVAFLFVGVGGPSIVVGNIRLQSFWLGIAAVTSLTIAANFFAFWRRPDGRREYSLGSTAIAIAFLVLVISAVFTFRPVPLVGQFVQAPLEVSPSFRASMEVAKRILVSKRLLGVGPGNFVVAYSEFRDPALNRTPFWQARFNHGYSFLSTIPATLGVMGTVAVFGFMALALVTLGQAVRRVRSANPYLWAAAAAATFVILEWFFYASNITTNFTLVMLLGLIGALCVPTAAAAGSDTGVRRSWWGVRRRELSLEAPAVNFVAAMVVVFVAAFSLVFLYGLGSLYAAEVYASRAGRVLNDFGNIESAKVFLDRAIFLNPTDDGYRRGRAQIAVLTVNRIISQAATAPSADLSLQFRDELSQGVTHGQRATGLSPASPANWFTLGQLYESVVAFVTDADRGALESYRRAAAVDPTNPEFHLAAGRVYLTQSDLLTLRVNTTSAGEERSRLEGERREVWTRARGELEAAVRLKSDYAAVHFLLAQLAIREGNTREAIRKAEETARLVPQDVGVAFQLGVLYYQVGNLDGARNEFERATLFNENYSNARYFLGLIWDQKGDKDAARSQFQKIAALNPENEEVKRVIANLEAGKPALDGIVPPAEPPEKRKETPVREKGEAPPPPRAPARPQRR